MSKNSMAIAVVLVVSISLWALVFMYFWDGEHVPQDNDTGQEKLINSSLADEAPCNHKMPNSGSKFLLSDVDIKAQQNGKLFIGNEHDFPVWVRIFEVGTSEEFGAIFLNAHKSSQFQLPVNGYKVLVESGTSWCSLQAGFTDAAIVQSDKIIHIQQHEQASLKLLSYGGQPADIMLSFSHTVNLGARSGQGIQGSGSLTLQRVLGGHYAVEGSINGVPAHFLVDTGATNVSIPASFAKHAGVTACQKSKTRTANGIANVCIAKARTLTIGQFRLRNVTVSYGKGLSDDTFLLGMNVIRQFRMEQDDDVMTLSRQ